MKVKKLQIKSAKEDFLKLISTIYLLHKNWVLDVPHIKKLVISCQNIWFHLDLKNIILKKREFY